MSVDPGPPPFEASVELLNGALTDAKASWQRVEDVTTLICLSSLTQSAHGRVALEHLALHIAGRPQLLEVDRLAGAIYLNLDALMKSPSEVVRIQAGPLVSAVPAIVERVKGGYSA